MILYNLYIQMARKTGGAKVTQQQKNEETTVKSKKEVTPIPTPTPTPAPTKVVEEPVVETQKGGGKKKRTFKIKLNENEFCSRITGHTPKQAASKALTLIINQKKQGGGKLAKGKITFTIKETTRGSKGKEYVYQGEKIKLKQPTTYKIRSPNGEMKEIVNRFRNVIEKYVATA
jgi:hypothetical protein